MSRVLYFPVVETEVQLCDLMSRAAWFLTAAPIDRLDVPVSDEKLASESWTVAPGMDRHIETRLERLREIANLVVTRSTTQAEALVAAADVVLVWRKNILPFYISADTFEAWTRNKRVWQVDPVFVRMEGSFYIEAVQHLLPGKDRLIEENRRKFRALASRIGRFSRAHLLATGPSVAEFGRIDNADSLGIVCNSVILDEELMDRVRPRIVVFADPIFHFGPSQYAADFRAALRDSAARRDFVICMPFKYYRLFISHLPELADRTIGIPFRNEIEANLDLTREFILKTTANILTFLMIPLGCTFSEEVSFLGCDGRPLSENNYFWGHNPRTQLTDKLANIRKVHPGFFNINYNEYYLEHCRTLEEFLIAGERAGKRFTSLAFSHIPALRARLAPGVAIPAEHASPKATLPVPSGVMPTPDRVLIIDPDGLSSYGHYVAYNDQLHAAMNSRGIAVDVLCNASIDSAILEKHPNYHPALSVHSWDIGPRLPKLNHLSQFQRELQTFLDGYLREHAGDRIVIYMYCGGLDIAKLLANLIANQPRLRAHINLFWLSFLDLSRPAFVERWKGWVASVVRDNSQLTLTSPTEGLQHLLQRYLSLVVDVAPHPSVTISDQYALTLWIQGSEIPSQPERFSVLFPALSRDEKGHHATLGAIQRLAALPDRARFIATLRRSFKSSASRDLVELPDFVYENASVLEGELSWARFDEMFRNAHIVVLPYHPEAFARRTSGLLIDAILYGVPGVVVRGTWLAEVVGQYGNGVTVESADPELIVQAVRKIADHYSTYQENTLRAARQYLCFNSWRALAENITADDQSPEFPRTLVIDSTPIGSVSAAGQLKNLLFRDWPARKFLQLCLYDDQSRLYFCDLTGSRVGSEDGHASLTSLLPELSSFQPEVIYYRPVPNFDVLFRLAHEIISLMDVPHVIHIMDDWMVELQQTETERFKQYDPSLRHLLNTAAHRLSISPAMSEAFHARYGVPFVPIANGVDVRDFP